MGWLGSIFRIVIPVVAAVIGFVISGFNPMGAVYGFGLGMAIGGALFPPEAENKQSQGIAQLQVSGSNYGGAIPVVYGSRRVAGNLIWVGALETVAVEHDAGGGGCGGGGGSYTTYDYYIPFAMAICLGRGRKVVTKLFKNKDTYFYIDGEVKKTSTDRVNIQDLQVTIAHGETTSSIRILDGSGWTDHGVQTGDALSITGFSFAAYNTVHTVQMIITSFNTNDSIRVGYLGGGMDEGGTSLNPSETAFISATLFVASSFVAHSYDGSQTTPDPTLAGLVTRCPTWRGLCYMVFPRFYLGNTPMMPQMAFEVADLQINDPTHHYIRTFAASDQSRAYIHTSFLLGGYLYITYGNSHFAKIEKRSPRTMQLVASWEGSGLALPIDSQGNPDDGYYHPLGWNVKRGWTWNSRNGTIVIQTRSTILEFDPGSLNRVKRHYLDKVIFTPYTAGNPSKYYRWQVNYTNLIFDQYVWDTLPYEDGTGPPATDWYVNGQSYGRPWEGVIVYDDQTLYYVIFWQNYAFCYYSVIVGIPVIYTLAAGSTGIQPNRAWFYDDKYYVCWPSESGNTGRVTAYNQGDFSVAHTLDGPSIFGAGGNILDMIQSYYESGTEGDIVVNGYVGTAFKVAILSATLGVKAGPWTYFTSPTGEANWGCSMVVYSGQKGVGSLVLQASQHIMVTLTSYDSVEQEMMEDRIFAVNLRTGAVDKSDVLPGITGVLNMSVTGIRGKGFVVGVGSSLVGGGGNGPIFTFEWEPEYYMDYDRLPQEVTEDILTNRFYGAGLDSAVINEEENDIAKAYAEENDMLISPAFDRQRSILDALQYVIQHHDGFITYRDGMVSHRQFETSGEDLTFTLDTDRSDSFADGLAAPNWRTVIE
jgi:hypothetical protein